MLNEFKFPRSLVAASVLGLAMASPSAQVEAAALHTNNTQHHGFNASLTVGWGFTPQTAIVVTDLGYYDADADGLVSDHEVGLFRASDRSLLAAAVVTDGDPLDGLFRYQSIGPVLLSPDETYFIAGFDPAFVGGQPYDAIGYPSFSDITFAPEIVFEGWQDQPTTELEFVSYSPSFDPWAQTDGPLVTANFNFRPVPGGRVTVSEPGVLSLLGLPILGMLMSSRSAWRPGSFLRGLRRRRSRQVS